MLQNKVPDELQAIHFFLSDRTRQGNWGWHTDTYDLSLAVQDYDKMVTVVVQCGDAAHTGMQMWLGSAHTYTGRGAAVAFNGGAVHHSIPWDPAKVRGPAVWKFALFLRLKA